MRDAFGMWRGRMWRHHEEVYVTMRGAKLFYRVDGTVLPGG